MLKKPLAAYRWLRTRVPLRYWAWIHFFLALGVGWGHAISIFPPTSYNGVVDLSLVFRMGVITALGSIVLVIGMLITRAHKQQTAHRGLWIELVGTILLGGGPLQYLGIQVGFLIDEGVDQRYALTWFAYAMCAVMLVRFSILIPALLEAARLARFMKENAQ